jgi:outer membrane lipoprotein-sorting protein
VKISAKWTAAFVAPSVIAAGAIFAAAPASAIDLPDVTAEELLLIMDGEMVDFSGTVLKTSNLGLPALEMSSMMSQDAVDDMAERMPEGFEDFVPQLIEQNALTQLVELAAGTHTMRVYASDLGMRVQVMDQMGQRDLLVTEDGFWAYDAAAATAWSGSADDVTQSSLEDAKRQWQQELASPEELVNALLDEARLSSTVSVGQDHEVAGRSAYQLIVSPNSSVSLIDQVVVSVDSETGMALDVKVFSREDSEAAFEVGFESIRFATPDADIFSFTPPPGTTVIVEEVPEALRALQAEYAGRTLTEADREQLRADLRAAAEAEGMPSPELLGDEWESVMYLAQVPSDIPLEMLETELFADLVTEVAGGVVFSTPILNVLVTDSGEIFAGSVTIAHLQSLAAR